MRDLVRVISGALVASCLWGQADQPTIKTSVKEVVVDAVIRDKHGKVVKNLSPADVSLYVDGAPQKIVSFRLVTGAEVRAERGLSGVPSARGGQPLVNPLGSVNVVCLVFHDLSFETTHKAMQSAINFLSTGLQPNTFVGVFTLDAAGVHPLYPFTNDRGALVNAIERATKRQYLASPQSVFQALNLQVVQITGPANTSSGPAGQGPPSTSPAGTGSGAIASLGAIGATPDAATTVGDDASVYMNNPLGDQSSNERDLSAMREGTGLRWLVSELSPLPFRKTVVLFSSGMSRPFRDLDRWKDTVGIANQRGISFYAIDLGENGNSPLLNAKAEVGRITRTSQAQSTPSPNAQASVDKMRQMDDLVELASNSNPRQMLRDLAEGTGGFVLTDASAKSVAKVMDEVETHYEIAFTPTAKMDGAYHPIKVAVANPRLMVDARSGFYAVPDGMRGLSEIELAGLRAINARPRPHRIEYRAGSLVFPLGHSSASAVDIAIEVPRSALTISPQSGQHAHSAHASFFGVIKNAQGEIVDQFSADAPEVIPDDQLTGEMSGRLFFHKQFELAPGMYHVETSVYDWLGGKSSSSASVVSVSGPRLPAISSLALIRREEKAEANRTGVPDPLVSNGKRIIPTLFSEFKPSVQPAVFFRVYPEQGNPAKPTLVAQLFVNGKLAEQQKTPLPEPDGSGSIPVTMDGPAVPGSDLLKIFVQQGNTISQPQALSYSVYAPAGR